MRKRIIMTFPDGSQKTLQTTGKDIENLRLLQKYPSAVYKNKKKIIERKKKYKTQFED